LGDAEAVAVGLADGAGEVAVSVGAFGCWQAAKTEIQLTAIAPRTLCLRE
jgi:hypothetical protein